MLDEKLTAKQIQMLLSMFIFGSSAVIGVSNAIGQDSWISLIFAALIAMPVILMYARIVLLNPDRQIFEIFESHFGKVAGKVASALMTWYAIHLGALVVRNFAEFIQISALLETPHLAVTILIFLTVCSLARYGGKALGKWSVIILPIVLGIVIITVFLSLNILEINHMLPVWERRTGEIIQDAFQVFSFPYAEIVMILGIADLINVRDKPHVIFMKSALTSTGILMMITLRNILVLGPVVMSSSYFPSYMAVRVMSLGDFLSRLEGSISINFMLAGITKLTLCLIVASRGIAHLFGLKTWRNLVYPTGLLMVALSEILYQNTMEMYQFIIYYPYYAALFQVVLPAATWIVSEVRAKRNSAKAQLAGQSAQ